MALYEMEDAKERVILVGVQENDAEPEEESLDELAELARTADPHPGTAAVRGICTGWH